MSIELSNVLVTQFAEEVKHKFQDESMLRDTVRIKDAKNAKTVKFPVMGKGLAQERSNFQTPLPVMNVTHSHATATVTNWTASELTDIFLENQVNFDEQQELVQAISMALGRRLDQIIIDSLVAAGVSNTVTANIGGNNTNMNLAKLQEIARLLDANGVPSEMRTLALHPNNLHKMLGENKITSADYAAIKALVQGDLGSFYGFDFKKIATRDEGGLPMADSDDRKLYAWHKQAVGLAMNMEPTIRIDYDETYGAHRVTGFLAAGATVIDETGVVEILADDDANPSA